MVQGDGLAAESPGPSLTAITCPTSASANTESLVNVQEGKSELDKLYFGVFSR